MGVVRLDTNGKDHMTSMMEEHRSDWPELPLAAWQDTYDDAPSMDADRRQDAARARADAEPLVAGRALRHRPRPRHIADACGARTFEVDFDFVDHQLVVRTSDGRGRAACRSSRCRSRLLSEVHGAAGVARASKPHIWPVPAEIARRHPLHGDRVHASYDADAAQRCWRVLAQADRVLKRFRGRFLGKCSPSHFWWGASTSPARGSRARPAPPHPGGMPNLPDCVTREAYSHECISAGWWPGTVGSPVAEPAFYAYAYPSPRAARSDRPARGGALRHGAARVDPALRGRAHGLGSRRDAAGVPAEHLRCRRKSRKMGSPVARKTVGGMAMRS